MQSMNYDAIIIGSGQGGNPLAQKLAGDGASVAIIEPGPLGGTCINFGCTPTKAMVASAQVAYYARNAKRWGVLADSVDVDFPAIQERKARIVAGFRQGWDKKLEGKEDPRLYRGRAVFTGERRVEVNGETLQGERIFIDAGAHPTAPNIQGLDQVRYLTYISMLELQKLPAHLVVLGGGYVGLEFGQMFRRFGSEVTVIQRGPQILPNEDDDITAELRKTLEAEGLRICVNARATRVEPEGTGIKLTFEGAGGTGSVSGSHLLVAVGRSPNTRDLGLEKTGVQVDSKGFIVVDEYLKTTAENIWALGDINGGPQFTHISYNDYQIIYANVYGGKKISTRTRLLPYAVYTDPTLGRVGLTEKEARAKGYKLKVGSVPMSWVARAIERGETAGLMKLVVDAANDKVLGASILASEGGELVQIISTLMLAEKPYTLLQGAIYIHPTLAEGFFSLMDSVKPVQ
jgi:pyruvate/2-oxoglutarate dehydrogenase complex dihydrolipoamide dehydrogenase (E3) component